MEAIFTTRVNERISGDGPISVREVPSDLDAFSCHNWQLAVKTKRDLGGFNHALFVEVVTLGVVERSRLRTTNGRACASELRGVEVGV